jgi:hypothetical protein
MRAAGNDNEIQFNNCGFLGAESEFTWERASKRLNVDGEVVIKDQHKLEFGPSSNATVYYTPDGTELRLNPKESGSARVRINGDAMVADESEVGSELVTNGSFTGSATGWTLGQGWAYGSNAVSHNSDGTGTLQQTITGIPGSAFRLSFTISDLTAGTLEAKINGSTVITVSDNGTHTTTVPSQQVISAILSFVPSNAMRGTIVDVSLMPIQGGDLFVQGDVDIMGDTSIGGTVEIGGPGTTGTLYMSDGGNNHLGLDSPALSSNWTLTLPASVPAGIGQHMESTDTDGNTQWASNYWDPHDNLNLSGSNLALDLTTGKEVVRATASSTCSIQAFNNYASGRFFYFINVGSVAITLVHTSGTGEPPYGRICTCDEQPLVLQQRGSALLWYDGTDKRWRVLSYQPGGTPA